MENRAQAFLDIWKEDRDYAILCLSWMTSAERAVLIEALDPAERDAARNAAIERRREEASDHSTHPAISYDE